MQTTTRLIVAASSLALLGVASDCITTRQLLVTPALAQQDDQAPKQVALTQKQIDGLIAAEPDIEKLQASAQQASSDRPDPRMEARMTAIVKRHGFDGMEEFEAVSDSVGIVMAGMDPETKNYIGAQAVIRKQMAQVQADKSIPPKDKAEAMKELRAALAAGGPPAPMQGNAEIVGKNYDKLNQAFQGAGGGGD